MGMVPYLKDESKWVRKQRSKRGKGKREWYSHPRRQNKRGEEMGNKINVLNYNLISCTKKISIVNQIK